MIDEIQNLDASDFKVVLSYHLGKAAPAPFVPVLAGLGTSSDVLKRNGLSRTSLGNTHTLWPLSADEAAVVGLMLEHVYVDPADAPDDWPETQAGLSDCWPMHLHDGRRCHNEGECAAVFRPPVLSNAQQERPLCYVWDDRQTESVYEKRELDIDCSSRSSGEEPTGNPLP